MRYRVVNLSGRPTLGQSRCDQIPAQYLSDRYNCEIEEFKRKIQAPGYSQPGPNIQANPPEPVSTSTYGGVREFPKPTEPTPVPTGGGWSPGTTGPITTEPQPPIPNPNEVQVIVPRVEPPEPTGPETNPPITSMIPQGGRNEEPPPLPPPPPYPPPLGPSVATPGGTGWEGFGASITICRVCPDGSFKMMNAADAAAAGCKSASDASQCNPKPPPPPPPLPPYPPPLGPSVPTLPQRPPIYPSTQTTTSTTATQGTRPTGMACPPGQNLLPDGSCGTPSGGGGPGACGPGQFWDGRQCRGSVAPGFGGYGSVAFGGGGGMAIPGGLEAGGGMTSGVSLMGRRYPVTNIRG